MSKSFESTQPKDTIKLLRRKLNYTIEYVHPSLALEPHTPLKSQEGNETSTHSHTHTLIQYYIHPFSLSHDHIWPKHIA